LRAKSGIMRGREFVMKDMYSFCLGEEDHERFYTETIAAYKRVYDRVGVGEDTFVTFASGGAFTQFSHEFQTLCDTGEDTIYINREKGIAINEEVLGEETFKKLGISRDELEEVKTAEVGNIFNFGTQKSKDLGLYYKDEKGEQVPVWMGSYGIGVTRLMGLLAEKFSDDKGLVWPESVAPFVVHLVELSNGNEDVKNEAAELYRELNEAGVEVLWDDRDARAGEKFADSDLLGLPLRVVVSEKTLAAGKFECVHRGSGHTEHKSVSELIRQLVHA
jgi:prolyl-tRNA synthetase